MIWRLYRGYTSHVLQLEYEDVVFARSQQVLRIQLDLDDLRVEFDRQNGFILLRIEQNELSLPLNPLLHLGCLQVVNCSLLMGDVGVGLTEEGVHPNWRYHTFVFVELCLVRLASH